MKTIRVEFYTWSRCYSEVEVPDDYQLLGNDPYVIWEEIFENHEDAEPYDLMTDCYSFGFDLDDNFELDQMGLDYIDSITIINDEGEVEQNRQFEKIIWDDWSRDRN